MAATFLYYFDNALKHRLDGTVNLKDDTLKVALLSSDFTPDPALAVYGDLEHEITGAGYDAGGKELASKTFSADPINHFGIMDAVDLTWAALTASNVKYAVLYKSAVAAEDRHLVAAWDLGDPQSPAGVPYKLNWNTGGILQAHN